MLWDSVFWDKVVHLLEVFIAADAPAANFLVVNEWTPGISPGR